MSTKTRAISSHTGSGLTKVDNLRSAVVPTLDDSRRVELGQFMTPARVARFMASLFAARRGEAMRLLDAGAGIGSLTAAVLERWAAKEFGKCTLATVAYELDQALTKHLEEHFRNNQVEHRGFQYEILNADFIEDATNRIQFNGGTLFTHAILNPPYRKINSNSSHRLLLRAVGIETVNLYTAFVGLAIELMAPGGELVAILPRSFCNGLYYRPFREWLLEKTAIADIHLFGSRTSAFSDDAVLQENIIIRLIRGGAQNRVKVTVSHDATFANLTRNSYAFEEIVSPNDPERFIHIPTNPKQTGMNGLPQASCTLADLGIEVSTGPVVDFRLRDFLRQDYREGLVPLLYAQHFTGGHIRFPQKGGKKANAIVLNHDTKKWLYPNGAYTVVRRFSSKEERRRVVAYTVDPAVFTAAWLGFENHLNVFHAKRKGLGLDLCAGLATYLNSTAVDDYFRRFSGHTQVNATDLRLLQYPPRETLEKIGQWARGSGELSQTVIDEHMGRYGKQ